MGFVVMVVVLVKDRQVHQRVEMHRRAGADSLVKLDRLGILGAAVVEHRQMERGLLVVGVFVQRPLVKFDRLFVRALLRRIIAATIIFLCSPLVD